MAAASARPLVAPPSEPSAACWAYAKKYWLCQGTPAPCAADQCTQRALASCLRRRSRRSRLSLRESKSDVALLRPPVD